MTRLLSIGNKYKRLAALMVVLVFLLSNTSAQNLNTRNKIGPMGIKVNTLTGNLFMSRNDLHIPARGMDMNLTFFYNSFSQIDNAGFGNGWNLIYHIKYKNDTSGAKKISWGDGREDFYASLPNGSFKTPKGFFNSLTEYQPNKFLLTEIDGSKIFFDNSTHRSITRMEDPNGNYLAFSYTDSLLTSIANAAGQSVSLSYNNGRLASVTDAISSPVRTYTYTYDGSGNLTKVTDPLNGTEKYTYLVNGPMKSITDKNNNTVDIIYYNDFTASELIGCNKRISFSYDTTTLTTYVTDYIASGNNQVTKYEYQKSEDRYWLTKISGNCCGFSLAFEFDAQGNKIKQTDANGNVYKYTYDKNGNLLTATDPLNQVTSFTYTADLNRIASMTDPKGNVHTLTYDSKGNLTKITEPGNSAYTATYNANGDIISSTDAKGNVYTYAYDAYGNPATVTGPNGYKATIAYDARGNLLSYTDARGNTETAQYDILDRLKKIVDPFNSASQFNYDAEGNITKIINKNNESSDINYDASNRIVKLTTPMGQQTQLGYDAMNNLTLWKNAVGNQVSLTYDSRNQLTSIKEPLNNNHSLAYDANGNLKTATLANGQTINYTYDQLDRMTDVSDITGHIVSFAYDANSNVTGVTLGDGLNATATYDNLNRLTRVTDPLGYASTYTYDQNGNVITATDRNGLTKHYTYDNLRRVKTFTDNLGAVIDISYDGNGNITQLKDQNNAITSYTYDELNRTKKVTYPDNRFVQFGYDLKGNITSKMLTDGSSITYKYDSLNRPVSRTLPDGQVISYGYDALGRVISATNNNGTVALTYDQLNRITSESFDGRVIRYNYNTAGRTQTTIYPDSTQVVKSFDTRNRINSITKNGTNVVSYQYNNQNVVTSKTFANGVNAQMQYDFANRLNTILTGNGTIKNTAFNYDKQRNKTSVIRVNNPASSEQFTYDNNYRLTNYKRSSSGATTIDNSYGYDALGNRTNATFNGVATTYTSNNLNQLTGSNNGSQNIIYTYDNLGNMTYDGTFYKTYNAEGRLMKDSSSPSNVITYLYDAFGRRVVKNINGAPVKYTYSGLAQIEERNGVSNDLLKRTVFRSFLTPVMMEKSNNNYYYHQNEMYSVEALTNNNGNVVERYQYDAYGKPTLYDGSNNSISTSVVGNNFAFTGQEYDYNTNTYRFHYRNYSPATGTFLQRDLIGYGDGMGMYQYVGNNPANGLDVLGLDDCNPKEKLSFVAIPRQPTLTLTVTQLVVDETGNTGFVLSVIDLPRQLAENAYKAQYLEAASKYSTLGEAAFGGEGLANAGANFSQLGSKLPGLAKVSGALGKAGPVLGAVDLGVKTANYNNVLNDPAASSFDVMDAGGDVVVSGGNLVGGLAVLGAGAAGSSLAIPAAVGLGVLAIGDAGSTYFTGKSIRQHNYDWQYKMMWGGDEAEQEYQNWVKTFGLEHSEFLRNIYMQGKGDTYLRTIRHMGPKPKCPQNDDPAGNQNRNPNLPGTTGSTEVISAHDPNEMVGPTGEADKRWVSVNDRLPYTILYENHSLATAPAKTVKITYSIPPKQDPATFQLSNFGFNSLTFTVPPGTASNYRRLDARDSLGLYIDVTAGYDQLKNQAFWEFQSIDPVTLLPPADPLKGFLLLQDSSNRSNGHGFVNFSIKPVSNANTGDTIGAIASILFDNNDTIPTNIAKNTIDAVAPVSHMNPTPAASSERTISLSWTGADDAGGSGLRSYTLYMSENDGAYTIIRSGIKRTDTTFTGSYNNTYRFFVLAVDSTGNMESLRPNAEVTVYITGGTLPVTWLSFNAVRENKDALLSWSTASEINSKVFEIERSSDGRNFSTIGKVNAKGTVTVQSNYTYLDKDVVALNIEVVFYRLKQVNKDGTSTYSNIVAVQLPVTQVGPIVREYPNPFKQTINLMIANVTTVGANDRVELYTLEGKKVYERKISNRSSNTSITLDDLPALTEGMYILKLQLNKQKFTFKVLKQ